MKPIKHNIGAQLKLPVERVVAIKGRKTYIVRYLDCLCRVPMFDWQEDEPTPKQIVCRLVSINDFGFPSFEQVARQKEVKLIEPVKPIVKREDNNSRKNQVQSFKEKYGLFLKPKSSNSNNDSKAEIANITNYRWSNQEEDFDKWFISTGGIKKRIEILISLAEQLAEYHRKNKVYKDFVPEYINIESSKWNVKATIPDTNYYYSGLGNVFIYASHAAPEVVNRRMPNTPMSDCYSFAIIAHELLAFCHPFVGNVVIDETYSMDEAMRGNLPWIDDSEDTHNRLTRRYYDSFFTTPNIRELFKQTFEIGKEEPMKRPSMSLWIDALYEAGSHLKYCPHCKTDFIYTEEDDFCPFCEDEPIFPIAVAIQRIDKTFDLDTYTFSETEKELYPDPVGVLLVNKSNKLYVNSRHLLTDTFNVKDVLSIEVVSSDGDPNMAVVLEPLNGFSFYASTVKGERYERPLTKPTRIVFPQNNPRKLVLSLRQIDESQRVLNVQLNNNNIYAEN